MCLNQGLHWINMKEKEGEKRKKGGKKKCLFLTTLRLVNTFPDFFFFFPSSCINQTSSTASGSRLPPRPKMGRVDFSTCLEAKCCCLPAWAKQCQRLLGGAWQSLRVASQQAGASGGWTWGRLLGHAQSAGSRQEAAAWSEETHLNTSQKYEVDPKT